MANSYRRSAAALLLAGAAAACGSGSEAPRPSKTQMARGDYLGAVAPGLTAQLFAPEVMASGLNERDTTFTPDGSEIYFTVFLPSHKGVILVVRRRGGGWTGPEVAPFSGDYSDGEPFVSPDGNRLFFASNRPVEPGGKAKDYDIWAVDRRGDGWGEARNLGAPVNGPGNEFYPSVTRDGTLYLTAHSDRGLGGEDILRAAWSDGRYLEPEVLPEGVNSAGEEFNAMISPDESFLIFTPWGRKGEIGRGDLFVAFRSAAGVWSEAVPLGPAVNSTALDYCPALSPDGRFLFFTSERATMPERITTFRQLREAAEGAGNGSGDVYWVSSDVIERLRSS